ncbi:DegV family protein [Syntrophomonas curvata]
MQRKIAQIVDSAGSIPREILKKYHIREVAFHINFGGQQQYREHINISSQEFYLRMKDQPDRIPKTSIPGVAEWTQAFEEKYAEGYRDLIVTTIGKALSSSFQSATMAANAFSKGHPDAKIEVVESNTCACGQAALEIKIAQLIEQGQMVTGELVKRVRELLPGVVSLFSVNELTYMRAGGRIGGAAAFLGKLINIKPVCEFWGGVVRPIKPVRCRKKALQLLVDEAVKRIKQAEEAVICVQHALCEEDADYLVTQLRERLNFNGPIYLSPVGAVIGAHSGPGAIGIGIAEG